MVRIPIVDRKDNIIGHKERSEIQDKDIYRVSACRITNSKGDILLAQRAFTKKNNPGARGPAVAGTVEGDETYLENILHEIPEEIGILLKEANLIKGPHRFSTKANEYFVQRFLAIVNLPISSFTKEEGKVEALKRWSQKELDQAIQHGDITFLSSVIHWRVIFTEYM